MPNSKMRTLYHDVNKPNSRELIRLIHFYARLGFIGRDIKSGLSRFIEVSEIEARNILIPREIEASLCD